MAVTTIHDVLEELFATATDEYDKGAKFERLMASYLRTDVTWADRFSNVWLWSDWPGRHGKPDTGIDLVAEERETGDLTAIQCKFYGPTHTLQKADIDSFFTASGKAGFTTRLIVSTTDKWSKNAEDALDGQQIPVTRLRVQDLDESTIDWSQFRPRTPDLLALKGKKGIWQHQQTALEDVAAGFTDHERGKLIMACGTGKTFTSLRIAERLVPVGGSVLFLVPSISLLSQTLKEWTAEAEVPLRPFAVCSDTKVGKKTANEDISPYDLAFPACTDAGRLHARIANGLTDDKITVILSTYQSLPVVAAAQELGLPDFDLVICDEAHRTTGVTLADEDDSNFVRVHDPEFLKATKRLYMTATPRIYDDASKSKASEGAAVLASMDNDAMYGPEFHRLGFGEAVSRGLLTDYKVLVLAVDEKAVSTTFQAQLADKNSELSIDDAAKIVGCWNGLAKKGRAESGFGDDGRPMGRAVAFARSIKDSQRFARLFTEIVEQYIDLQEDTDEEDGVAGGPLLRCEAQHVDGTFNVLRRNERLDWLKAPLEADSCRVLSNARCLTEGVDIPALDAVMFLNPRNSVVDVVQAVGRVMRKAPDKQYGYVILPIGIPADMTPEQALANNEKYKVVWQVLQALRAHDERFNAMVNKLELNNTKTDKLQIIGVSGFERDTETTNGQQAVQQALNFPQIGEWRDAIYAKIVKKVGDRRYWEDWAKSVAEIAEKHTTRIKALLADPKLDVDVAFDKFLEGLRGNLNDGITRDDAIDMLAQHLITKPVFDALFEGYSFTEQNPVSQVMQHMLDVLDDQNLNAEHEGLERFYESVRVRAEGIDNAEGKQAIISELYEKFFKIAFPRAAESLGIVYTPVEIVDFVLRSVEHVLDSEFDASLTNSGVHVLDPFTGTGTFITRLLQSGLIHHDDLLRKYTEELHANEILLLAYYIAAINIEATYHGLTGGEYMPFNGIVLTDTFQTTEVGDTMDDFIFPDNNERVAHQKALDIRVIIGNPPYSVGQTSQNDANQNQKYPTLDAAIAKSYAAGSSAGLKRNLYDSYIRAIRWATDRIGTEGVVCYVSNGGWIDSGSADGLRKSLASDFDKIYCFNLRGNQRTSGELSRKEGGKVFGAGSRSTVAILLLVRTGVAAKPSEIRYRDVGDYLTRDQKLEIVATSELASMEWQRITPNANGDWVNQRNTAFATFTPMGDKAKGASALTIFRTYSVGLATSRDAWSYNFSVERLANNMGEAINFYNEQMAEYAALGNRTVAVDDFVNQDPTRISWSRGLKGLLSRRTPIEFRREAITLSTYRPFTRQYAYADRQMAETISQLPSIFPSAGHPNVGIVVTGVSSHYDFTPFITDAVPDLHLLDTGQFFPRYTYRPRDLGAGASLFSDSEEEFDRIDNITDAALAEFRKAAGGDFTKDDVFYYVYGMLHAPSFRSTFAADLKKMLPRIPRVPSEDAFNAYSDAGRRLAELHLRYDRVEPWPLTETITVPLDAIGDETYLVHKMTFGAKKDRTRIIFNNYVTLSDIPVEAYNYTLGSRSAIEWIMERYQVKTDKASGILNDPNDWVAEVGEPRYILDLVKRIVRVSVETMEIVHALPPLTF